MPALSRLFQKSLDVNWAGRCDSVPARFHSDHGLLRSICRPIVEFTTIILPTVSSTVGVIVPFGLR